MGQTAIIILIAIICLLFVLFLTRKTDSIMKIFGSSVIRITIAVLLLFFFNVFGGHLGWHIPINIFTVIVTSVLGVFGMGTLFALQLFFL